MWIPKDTHELKTWAGAQDFCVDKGGTLVSIESELDQGRVQGFNQAKMATIILVVIKTSPPNFRLQINI